MQQLAPRDAFFLSSETPQHPAHIGGLVFLNPSEGSDFGFDTFVEFVRERLAPIERFSWRLQEVPFGLDRPYWVKTDDFDPADHVHAIRIPEPYSPEALSKLVGRIFERPMDRRRPLWDMVLIEGLPGGRYALVWRTHHCLMDGASGANLSAQLYDISPDGARIEMPGVEETATAAAPRTPIEIATRAARNAIALPREQARYAGRLLEGVFSRRRDEARGQQTEGDAGAGSEMAPPALFNGVTGTHRRVAWATVPFDDVKRLKNTVGATVNDVVLAITGGAVRAYHARRDALPEASFVAGVPVSTRAADDKQIGNQVVDANLYWGTDLEDPVERLTAIHERAQAVKREIAEGGAFDLIGLMSEALLPGALQLMMRGASAAGDRMPLPSNAVVSNVPMAPMTLYCAGAKIEQVVPLSILGPTQGLNITVVSYDGALHFGLVFDPEMLEAGWEIAEAIPKQMLELQAAIDREIGADPA